MDKQFVAIVSSLIFTISCAGLEIDNYEDDPSPVTPEASTSDDQPSKLISNATSADCHNGEICFYTGANLTGLVCRWSSDDRNWTKAPFICSWATSRNACSVWNRTRGNIEYFYDIQNNARIGSTNPSVAGNLRCNYHILSHRCTSSNGCY